MKNENFGLRLNRMGEHLKMAREITAGITDAEEKAKVIYYHVVHKMKWNNVNSLRCTERLAKIYKDSIGNSCEINLLLVDMLRAAGLKADPVLISTREHGMFENSIPDIFNSMM